MAKGYSNKTGKPFIPPSWAGKKHLETTKKKMRMARLKNPIFFLGENHPNWKGGLTINGEHRRTKLKEWVKRVKLEVFELLGNKCKGCGVSDWRVLQIDHINGGGTREKKIGNYWTFFRKEILSGSKKYQLLCANCNWIKKYENNEVRQKKIKVAEWTQHKCKNRPPKN